MEHRPRSRGGSWRRGAGGGGGGGGGESGAGTEHRGRGRGGQHRGRGRRDHHRGRGRSGPFPSDRHRFRGAKTRTEPTNVEDDVDNNEEEEEGAQVFSRRKLASNWDRYEAAEKEELGEESLMQRGQDFHVLLSSAGDSFTQFRFSEEKEWEVDASANNQMSALFVDCQSLARSLQELPLHERLNLEAELVQLAVPVELPVVTLKNKQDSKLAGQFGVPSPMKTPLLASAAHSATNAVSKTVDGTSLDSKPLEASLGAAQPPADDIDEDLDMLLNLETAVPTPPDSAPSRADEQNTAGVKAPAPELISEGAKEEEPPTPEADVPKKDITEDDLEDWLDSMIS
ncbi:cell death regulator Aven isoform X2 [Amia ocellicauda]|uniref:cell death regulator Aven isoform X2 n=1 Tax=Amia ocellicauda TaxID=2972642 RepID=UPI003463E462